MLSAVISSERSYSTVPLAGQPIHQRFVRSGLLILGAAPLNLQRLQQIRTDDLLLSNHINYLNYVCGALSFLQGLHIAMQSGLSLHRVLEVKIRARLKRVTYLYTQCSRCLAYSL